MTTNKPHIICICAGIGFPIGQANTNRMCHIGRTIIDGGGQFTVWHFGTSPNDLNQQKKGTWNGITYEYLCTQVKRPKSSIVRQAVHFTGMVRLLYKIFSQVAGRRNTYLFIDLQKTTFNILLTPLCRLLGIKTVQEVNEWWPDVKNTSKLINFQYKRIMFRYSNGSFVISNRYQEKVLRTTAFHRHHKFFYLPVIAEPVVLHQGTLNGGHQQPTVFWCGMVDGYLKDVLFMINAFKAVYRHHPSAKLVISGKYSSGTAIRVAEELKTCGIPSENFMLTGFIGNDELERYVNSATVLAVPMWNDDRSGMRFPTKLGLFAFGGKGIVTAPVGELKEYFVDEENCLFYEPGNVQSLSDKINELLANNEKRERLGRNARMLAENTFSYKNYVQSMQEFFVNL
jgi:glycosyltransferase involved in cell wall biosynthesis